MGGGEDDVIHEAGRDEIGWTCERIGRNDMIAQACLQVTTQAGCSQLGLCRVAFQAPQNQGRMPCPPWKTLLRLESC